MDKQEKALFAAVESNDLEGVRKAIENETDVNARNEVKRAPLYIACVNENWDIAELLIQNGADIFDGGDDTWTPQDIALPSGVDLTKFKK